jgi:oligopeptide transport system ATP-binding protein
MSSLNPVHTVGAQIAETLIRHKRLPRKAAMMETVALLEQVGIPEPGRRASAYPHQLSGGMRQRVMIAIALACRPGVLIADEPTTALDVTIQAEILDLLQRLQKDTGMAMIFITHNLGIVAQIADRVMVMYSGQVVEEAPAASLLGRLSMPYTMGLMRSLPRLEAAFESERRLTAIPGNVPDPRHRPSGCVFHPRCQHVLEPCKQHQPMLEQVAPAHLIRCGRWREITA